MGRDVTETVRALRPCIPVIQEVSVSPNQPTREQSRTSVAPSGPLLWDETHLKALLRIPRYPLQLIQMPPWSRWIQERGGLTSVQAELAACSELTDQQRRMLAVVLAHPERA